MAYGNKSSVSAYQIKQEQRMKESRIMVINVDENR